MSRLKKRNTKQWFVYIVECRNKSLYTGITNNIERRIKEHNSKKGGHYTKAFGPVKLLCQESYRTRSLAMKREVQIKKLSRQQKKELIQL